MPELSRWCRTVVDPESAYFSDSLTLRHDIRDAVLSANEQLSDDIVQLVLYLFGDG